MRENSKRANGLNSVYQTKDGRWVAQIVIGKTQSGATKYKRFSSKKRSDVIEKMKNYEKGFTRVKNADGSYLDDYLKGYVENIKAKTLKPSSYDRDYRTYEFIKERLGMYQIGELTPEIITEVLIDKVKDEGYSYSTTHKALVLLNQCLDYAVRNSKISNNPCKLVEQPRRKNYTNDKKKVRFLNDEEIKKFMKQAVVNYSTGAPRYPMGLVICLIIYTGLRGGELAAIKWEDVDFENKIMSVTKNISICHQVSEDGAKTRMAFEQNSTKTSEHGRIVPLNSQAIEILQKLKDRYGETSPDNYIVNNSTKLVSVDIISYVYTNIARVCNIENPCGIHTLRHTFASLMIRKGTDIKVLSEILGHKDVSFTYNVYVHLINEQKAKAVEMIDLNID